MNLQCFTLNEIGGRKNVEDSIYPKKFEKNSLPVFIVCDGVGGSSYGEVASDIAVKSFAEVFGKNLNTVATNFKSLLDQSLVLFKKRVNEFIEQQPSAANTSTTLTIAVVQNNKAYLAWCGDSRIYHVREGKIRYRTKDHSLVNELVMQGVITEDEAAHHPQRNVITRSLSADTKPSDIDIHVIEDFRKDDWLLLCTDGLLEKFSENKFAALLGSFDKGTDYSSKIDAICRNNTKDNYSMCLVNLREASSSPVAKYIGITAALVVLAAGGYFAYSHYAEQPVEAIPQQSIMLTAPVFDTTKQDTSSTTLLPAPEAEVKEVKSTESAPVINAKSKTNTSK